MSSDSKEVASPCVSVLVPCYNDAETLDDALGSIAAQTFSDFEVIVSDDGSTDSSVAIAQGWVRADSRFRLLTSEHNLGAYPNWNRALSAARGSFIGKLDADDWFTSKFLETMLEELRQVSASEVVFCRAVECDLRGIELSPWRAECVLESAGFDPSRRHAASGEEWLRICFEDQQLWHSNAFLTRRKLLESIGGWDERYGCAGDTDLFLRLLDQASWVVHLPMVGVRARRRPGSVSHRAEREGWKSVESILVHLEAIQRMIDRRSELTPRLRWHWWRLWSALRRVERGSELQSKLPSRLATAVEVASASITAPPLSWRLAFRARGAIHDAIRRG